MAKSYNMFVLSEIFQKSLTKDVTSDEVIRAMDIILGEKMSHAGTYLVTFLSLLQAKRIEASLIRVLIDNILRHTGFLPFSRKEEFSDKTVCVAGSGKKSLKTMNISTMASLVASGLGAMIVKPTSCGVTSLLGSRDLLERLEVQTCSTVDSSISMIRKVNIAFIAIENMIPEFDMLYAGKQLTISPLSYVLPAIMSPLSCGNVFYGLSDFDAQKSIELLKLYGYSGNIAIANTQFEHGYIDELTFSDSSSLTLSTPYHFSLNALDWNRRPCSFADIRSSGDVSTDFRCITKLIDGNLAGEYAETICLNAAAILLVAKIFPTIQEALENVRHFVSSGGIRDQLNNIKKSV